MRTLAPLLLAAVLAASGCAAVTPANAAVARSEVGRAAADPARAADVAPALNGFGLELYRALVTRGTDGGLVVSPASIVLALAMARAGARGQTAAQMDTVMERLGSARSAAALNALEQALAARSGSFKAHDGKAYDLTLRIANAPFAQRDTHWEQAFLDALARDYGADIRLVDYKADADGARRQINGWVGDETEGRIPELLAPDLLDSLVRLVLVNAIYLKAPWQTAFPASATHVGAFTRLDGSTVSVPMMAVAEDFPYAEGPGWRAVELPYVGGSLALDVIVPEDLAAFEASSVDIVATATGSLSSRHVELELPRFEAETRVDLAELLASLGMADAFDPNRADFTGMTTAEQLYISNVVHQANISVDEKGTEAAAATAVVMRTTAMPAEPVRLSVDRPFFFAVRDVPTGAILFLGRIVDPSAG